MWDFEIEIFTVSTRRLRVLLAAASILNTELKDVQHRNRADKTLERRHSLLGSCLQIETELQKGQSFIQCRKTFSA